MRLSPSQDRAAALQVASADAPAQSLVAEEEPPTGYADTKRPEGNRLS
jgi:hypothetical protein